MGHLEPAFSENYYQFNEEGTHVCAGCGNPVFTSDQNLTKRADGWPSFRRRYSPAVSNGARLQLRRTARLSRLLRQLPFAFGPCFDDGPILTGNRFALIAGTEFHPALQKLNSRESGEFPLQRVHATVRHALLRHVTTAALRPEAPDAHARRRSTDKLYPAGCERSKPANV